MASDAADATLSLSEVAREDIAHLTRHREALKQVATAIAGLEPGVGLSEAVRSVAETSGIARLDAARILSTIQNLQRLRDRQAETAAQTLKAITARLEVETNETWKTENLEPWKTAVPTLTELLDSMQGDHPLVVARKAEQLGSEHQNQFMHARVVTELRPIFNAAGNSIHESLIVQSLLVDYYDGTQPRRLELALDAADVAHLKRLCERAEGKAVALKASLADVSWPTVVVGQDEGA